MFAGCKQTVGPLSPSGTGQEKNVNANKTFLFYLSKPPPPTLQKKSPNPTTVSAVTSESNVLSKQRTPSANMTRRFMLSDEWMAGAGKLSDPWLFDTAGLLPLALHSSLATTPRFRPTRAPPSASKLPPPSHLRFSFGAATVWILIY